MQFWSLFESVRSEDPQPLSYAAVGDLQRGLVELRARDQIPDTILFLEHSPVITRGRGLQFAGVERPRHMPIVGLLPKSIEFCESERGGDLTYHGPGQLVVYPIIKLDGRHELAPKHDIGTFLRRFEARVIEVINESLSVVGASQDSLGRPLLAHSRENATGVWVGDRKIASMGIAIRKWVTYHGMAINIVNDLKPFHLISPCGFAPEVMTRFEDLAPASSLARLGSWRAGWEQKLARKLSSDPAVRVEARSLRELFGTGDPGVESPHRQECL